MRIALATSRDLPDLDADDHGYVDALKDRGASVDLVVWDKDGAVDRCAEADLVVIRSTWDYSEKRDDFVAWAAAVEARTRLLNPAPVVRWNTDKKLYLGDLAAQGLPVVPTLWLDKGAAVDVADAVAASFGASSGGGVDGVVIKPVIGAGSRDTVKVMAEELRSVGQRFVDATLPRQALMVQPFLPRIAEGEVSLIFLDGRFSHAVVKRPKAGDFRSQPEFGSTVLRHTPSDDERRLADRALHLAGGFPLYARVDLVKGLDGRPCVIELEMVEPSLYFAWSDDAAVVLAEATLRRASSSR